MSPAGLLVHHREGWPCAVCRPGDLAEGRGYCLCLDCAYALLAVAGAGEEGARGLLEEIAEALSPLETRPATN